MLQIRPAQESEYPLVRGFYHALIDAMENAEFKPGWEKDVYPAPEFLMDSIRNGELYIGFIDEKMVSCMVLNNQYNEGYKEIQWSVDADDSDILVIHALGVAPAFGRRGIAKDMVRKAIETAKERHIKAIRLDVLGGNIPAIKAYTKMAFQHMGTVQMFYEDTGTTSFDLFEYIL